MARRNKGFTLLDLMAAVLSMGVALGLALPSFAALLERNRVLAIFHELGAALAGARMAAVQLGRPVTVCPSQDGLRCRRDLVWEDGWMTYIDADRSDQPRSADAVIRHERGHRAHVHVRLDCEGQGPRCHGV